MSIKLMVEVLDHYHGPHARKLWLLAWAEKVPDDGSRTGYCKREVLVARLGRSPSRVSGIARELEDEGVTKRLGGGVWGRATVYELLPLAAVQGQLRADPTQGQPRADPTAEPRPHSQGQPRTDAQGQPRADPNPHNPHKPSSSSARTPRTGSRGEPAATADDDDLNLSTTDDPREMLARFGTTQEQIEPAFRLLARLTPDVAGYLRAKCGSPDEFMRWLRRQLTDQDADAGDGP